MTARYVETARLWAVIDRPYSCCFRLYVQSRSKGMGPFFNGAATPPNLGGVFRAPDFKLTHYQPAHSFDVLCRFIYKTLRLDLLVS